MQACGPRLRRERKLHHLKAMRLSHRRLRAIAHIADTAGIVGRGDVGAIDVPRLFLRGKEQMITAFTAGDVDRLSHFDETFRSEDCQPAVPLRVEPVSDPACDRISLEAEVPGNLLKGDELPRLPIGIEAQFLRHQRCGARSRLPGSLGV